MKLIVHYLGNRNYSEAFYLQKETITKRLQNETNDTLYLLEHPHVVTIGKMGHGENLLVSDNEAKRLGVEIHKTDRGGDITYHGPGQLVGYPIINLQNFRKDVKWYLEMLEQSLIDTLSEFGIASKRIEGYTGVWVEDRKIASIGVRVEKWVTSHGFALNVNTDLDYFKLIVPCGLADKPVTSMEKESGHKLELNQVADKFKENFKRVFGFES